MDVKTSSRSKEFLNFQKSALFSSLFSRQKEIRIGEWSVEIAGRISVI